MHKYPLKALQCVNIHIHLNSLERAYTGQILEKTKADQYCIWQIQFHVLKFLLLSAVGWATVLNLYRQEKTKSYKKRQQSIKP